MQIKMKVNSDCILLCTTTGYYLPCISSLLKKRGLKERKENEVAKSAFFKFAKMQFSTIKKISCKIMLKKGS